MNLYILTNIIPKDMRCFVFYILLVLISGSVDHDEPFILSCSSSLTGIKPLAGPSSLPPKPVRPLDPGRDAGVFGLLSRN
jgi:hypothetical protein